jgi:ribulose-bisphosphate carboxylase large chain
VAPGLTGFGALQELADDEACALPIASHPSLLGTYGVDPDSGIAPAALYGRLPRLAGADISIYPTFGTGYAMTRADCTAVAEACRTPWRQITATLPTAAGRIGPEHVAELGALYGRDVLFILGSRVQQDPAGVAAATGRFVREIERAVG